MPNIKDFSSETIKKLGNYVYVYSDPDTHIPFYVGKGKGNRVFDHLSQENESAKVKKIKEIHSRGKEPLIEILIHGIDEQTALKVEAAAIDLIGIENLTNEQRGHHVSTYGRIEANTLNSRYSGEHLALEDIKENVMLIKVNKLYRNDMEPYELYEITRGCWKVNLENAQKADYAFAVYDGMVMEVYSILQWFKTGSIMWGTRKMSHEEKEKISDRYEFVGDIAPDNIRGKYINKSISDLFATGEQNPIKYIFNNKDMG